MPTEPTSAIAVVCPTEDLLADTLEWAARIARGVARQYRFGGSSQEAADLESVAQVTLCEQATRFEPASVPAGGDPNGQFRGWSHRAIRTACQREAARLRGGGTFHTRRPGPTLTADPLGDRAANLPDDAGPGTGGDPVTRVFLNGTLYAIPFERTLRPLSGQELDDLEADVAAHGVLDPLTVCTLPDLGPAVIDGSHRARIAASRGLRVPLVDLGLVTWVFAQDRARALNVLRRQLTAEEIRQERQARRGRVLDLREAGYSLRMIAATEGYAHPEQVRRDLQAGDGTGDTPVSPGQVVGLDGRRQSATKPPPGPAVVAARAAKALDTAFRHLGVLLRGPGLERLRELADELDIPFDGQDSWPALTALTRVRGLLARVG